MEIGVVILNYLNWTDTVECIDSLKDQTNQNFQIVVVDNASANESFSKLKQIYDRNVNVHLLRTKENLGFAKGNNTGVVFCKKVLGINNILVVNNDVIFTDQGYIEFLQKFEYDKTVGVIGTKIIGSDGQNQNPHYFNPSFKSVFREFSIPILCKYHLDWILGIGRKFKKNKPKITNTEPSVKKRPYVLHGSAFFLTENYISRINGLYPETFLYYEEEILGLVCSKLKLKMLYTELTEIYHKEDQSSNLSFQNLEGIKQKFARRSVATGLKVSLLSNEKVMARINNYPYCFTLEKNGKPIEYKL